MSLQPAFGRTLSDSELDVDHCWISGCSEEDWPSTENPPGPWDLAAQPPRGFGGAAQHTFNISHKAWSAQAIHKLEQSQSGLGPAPTRRQRRSLGAAGPRVSSLRDYSNMLQ